MIQYNQDKEIKMPQINAIVCVGPNGLIGTDKNVMPWHSVKDFFHFVYFTKYKPCIFGANTFFNMPKYPLPHRLNVVLSSKFAQITHNEYVCAPNFEAAIEYLKSYPEIMICGGNKLYTHCFNHNYIDNFILTTIDSPKLQQISENKNNIFFPEYILSNLEKHWKKTEITYDKNPKFPTNADAEFTIRFWKYQNCR